MSLTTITRQEFHHNVTRAERAAQHGPVLILRRGKPEHVLLSVDEYQKLTGHGQSLAEALAMPHGGEEVEFSPPKLTFHIKPADFS